MSELEIMVDLGKDDPNIKDMIVETGEEAGGKRQKKGGGGDTS